MESISQYISYILFNDKVLSFNENIYLIEGSLSWRNLSTLNIRRKALPDRKRLKVLIWYES